MYIEKINALLNKCPASDYDDIEKSMKEFVEYINRIVQEGSMLTMYRIRHDQQDYVEYAQRLYSERNRIHDVACVAAARLNEIAKRNHMREIFPDFVLEKANDPTRTVIYNGETHRKVNIYCAVLANEFFHEGSLALEQYLMDQVAHTNMPYTPPTIDDMKSQANKFMQEHYRFDLKELACAASKDELKVQCYDGASLTLCTTQHPLIGMSEYNSDHQMYTADCSISVKEINALTLGSMPDSGLLDNRSVTKVLIPGTDKIDHMIISGCDMPIALLEELIPLHGGIKSFEEIDRSKEKTLFEAGLNICGKNEVEISLTDQGVAADIIYENMRYSVEFSARDNSMQCYRDDEPILLQAFTNKLSPVAKEAFEKVLDKAKDIGFKLPVQDRIVGDDDILHS